MVSVTPSMFSARFAYAIIICILTTVGLSGLLRAENTLEALSAQKTRTVVADVLDVDGEFLIVRGEAGEIRIEVIPETTMSETFAYGDRIKAILLPNDVGVTITRAAPDEPIGITNNESIESPASVPKSENQSSKVDEADSDTETAAPYEVPKVRVIIANILMVDGSFYIVRTEWGEIQIEITPNTELSEDFDFGDKIKARVTPSNTALSIIRAGNDDPFGIHKEGNSQSSDSIPRAPAASSTPKVEAQKETSEPSAPESPTTRTIVADVLMVEGDLYIVRGESGEIRIEVTPETTASERFDYGDRIKAEVLPNDKALTIERANPNDPIGITPN